MIATYDGKNRNLVGFDAGFEKVLEGNFKAQKARALKAFSELFSFWKIQSRLQQISRKHKYLKTFSRPAANR